MDAATVENVVWVKGIMFKKNSAVAAYVDGESGSHHLWEIGNLIEYPSGIDLRESPLLVFGPTSESIVRASTVTQAIAVPDSSISQAIDYALEEPNRVLAVAFITDLSPEYTQRGRESYPQTVHREVLDVLESLYAAGSSVFIKYKNLEAVKGFWAEEWLIPNYFSGDDLEKLIISRRSLATDRVDWP